MTPSPVPRRVHTVRQGETLRSIALQYGLTTRTLMEVNPEVDPERLQIGQKLLVPAVDSVVHVVKRGEMLRTIARDYGIDTTALIRANPDVNPERLIVGQRLTIPLSDAAIEAPSPAESRIITHTVRSGDTLLSIANEYGTSINDIYALNAGVSPQSLRVGQVLRIKLPPPTPTPTSTPAPSATRLPFPAPALLGPGDGADFQGADAHILLWWTSVGILGEDEWYVVRMVHDGAETEGLTKAPSWRVPSELYPDLGDSPVFQWYVLIATAPPDAGRSGRELAVEDVLSPPSLLRSISWR